jgi:hypothetical protein
VPPRARTVKGPDAKAIDPSAVYSLQLMLSKFEYDGRHGGKGGSLVGAAPAPLSCQGRPPALAAAPHTSAAPRRPNPCRARHARRPNHLGPAWPPVASPPPGQLNPSFSPGPFQLPISEITTYFANPIAPRLVHVSSAGVTRPNRPGINVDQVRGAKGARGQGGARGGVRAPAGRGPTVRCYHVHAGQNLSLPQPYRGP